MKKDEIVRFFGGYVLGFVIFILGIPTLIYLTAVPIPICPVSIIRYIIVICLLAVGVIFVGWSNIDLLRIGKGGPADLFNIAVSPRSKKLVTGGPYQYTRNPMVFGTNTLYVAFAIYLNSLIALLFVLCFLCVVVIYLKFFEEKRLLNDFGDDYVNYKKQVPMIFPRIFYKKTVH